jgi:hypothetical protein
MIQSTAPAFHRLHILTIAQRESEFRDKEWDVLAALKLSLCCTTNVRLFMDASDGCTSHAGRAPYAGRDPRASTSGPLPLVTAPFWSREDTLRLGRHLDLQATSSGSHASRVPAIKQEQPPVICVSREPATSILVSRRNRAC